MTTTDITASLQKFWMTAGPMNIKTIFSGAPLDVAAESTWMEFWISQVDEESKRPQSPRQNKLLIDLHFFSIQPNKRAINELIDEARQSLRQVSLPVYSSSLPATQVGQLRCLEPTVRDMSRVESVGSARIQQHFVMSLIAVATEAVD